MMAQIKLVPIGLTQIDSRSIRAWAEPAHFIDFDSFFILNFINDYIIFYNY